MKNCYNCIIELTPENSSNEHILQNSIGGRLKSPILCKDCNSKMGAEADAAFAATMNTFSNMLDIKRERGNPQSMEGTLVKSGERIIIDPGGKPRFPTKVKIDKSGETVSFQIQAQNLLEASRHLKSLKRKYPKLDIEAALQSVKTIEFEPGEQIQGKIEFGDERIFPAIVKSAINFYIHNNGKREYIASLLPYINGLNTQHPVGYFYPNVPVFEDLRRDTLHQMFLVGDPTQGILYCVITYFGTMNYVVLLNHDYNGPEMAFIHTLHPSLGYSQERKPLRFLDRAEIVDAIENSLSGVPDHMIDRIQKFLNTAFEKQAALRECDSLVQQALNSTPPEEGELTPGYMMRVLKAMEPGLMPMIQAASKRRRDEAEEDFRKQHAIPAGESLFKQK